MTNANDSAFARPSTGHLDSFIEGSEGLTKREYFAVMAMQGYAANKLAYTSSLPHQIAEYSTELADALINELNKNL